MNSDIEAKLDALARSRFRGRFRLKGKEADYLREKGMEVVMVHAREFVVGRLGAAEPVNDGKQTPMRNHPVFVAQHATGTCCRKCLEKWHGIRRGIALDDSQVEYVMAVIGGWLERQTL